MLEVIQDYIPKGRKNRPAKKMIPEWICLHDTSNPNKGADAAAHAKYLRGDSAAEAQVSWHFTVDDKRAVQHLPLDETAYHAGDGGSGPGNTTSIGIEICENADGDRSKAEANAAELIISLLRQYGFGIDRIVPHKRWSGKNCPHLLLPRWEAFIEGIRGIVEPTPPPINAPTNDSSEPSVTVNLMGAPQCSPEQAARWARSRGATEQFVNLAPIYWKKGEVYGLRADILYAQAAKETGFGRFGGAVTPDMHNFAGIKVKSPTGDARDDHETFPDDDTGVHAHFQHICAYVGLPIVGAKTHARQDIVRSLAWAGTVKTVEGLSGRWAPNPDYGASIVRDYLTPLLCFTGFEDYAEMTPCAKCQEFEVEIAALKEKINRARHHIEDLLGMF